MSSYDKSYDIETLNIEGHEFELIGICKWDTPDYISHAICLNHEDWQYPLVLKEKGKSLMWSDRTQTFSGGIKSVRELDSSDVAYMLLIDSDAAARGLTLAKIQRMYKKQHGEAWDVQMKLVKLLSPKAPLVYHNTGGKGGDEQMVHFAEDLGFECDPNLRHYRSTAQRAAGFLLDLGYTVTYP